MVTAKLRYLRVSPRKVRLVTNLIKGLTVEEAARQLKFLGKRAARPILKLLNSAVANAQHNANLAKESLYVARIIVEAGPTLKRWQPRAMGRATLIRKRTSHITLVLEQKGSVIPPGGKEAEVKPAPLGERRLRRTVVEKKAEPTTKKEKTDEEKPGLLEEVRQPTEKVKEEKGPVMKPGPVPPPRPYPTTSQAKKRFFSRQTFGNVKKIFRRKSF